MFKEQREKENRSGKDGGKVADGLTWRLGFYFLAECGANTVVIGTDVVQAPSCQLISIVKLQAKRVSLHFLILLIILHKSYKLREE